MSPMPIQAEFCSPSDLAQVRVTRDFASLLTPIVFRTVYFNVPLFLNYSTFLEHQQQLSDSLDYLGSLSHQAQGILRLDVRQVEVTIGFKDITEDCGIVEEFTNKELDYFKRATTATANILAQCEQAVEVK